MDTPSTEKQNEPAPSAIDKEAADKAAVARKEYRASLLSLQTAMQSEYDKALLTLSGGAFGVTALFVKDLIGTKKAESSTLLFLSWLSLAFSIMAVIASYYTSASAMEKAVRQNDAGTINEKNAGGLFNKATQWLNISAGILFCVGVILFSVFVLLNL